ncbi:hypothetical protein DL765_010291 [Monosporascus sp. GIB2]|nr:hypothetical protein DL765_010291 [Monosporascus sp. GIB2]
MNYTNSTTAIMANVILPSEPTRAIAGRETRITKGGRHLWYELDVIQQPERARACGSGPKSSADRRPVDPPPVLQFKVLEGENYETARDITFDYNADFFVFASLEHARPMAHGRVQTPAATSPPVLTGFPVAGCCYLDRPEPAGYFIFPDLSVRHEGRYRLVFTLYEQIKDPQDEEVEPRAEDRDGMAGGEDDGQGFYHRMEVKSDDFAVFSAKKFPGLSESTALSRTVAEQGCRVRIRRDVRMRIRDKGKPSAGADYEDNAEEEYNRRRRTQTPEVLRPRSVSNTSMDATPYGHDHSRRPSNADYGHHPPPPPMYQPNQPGRILSFGHGGQDCAPPVYAPPPPPPGPLSTPVSPAHPPQYHPTSQVSSYPPPSPGFMAPQPGYYERPPSRQEQEAKIQPSYNYSTTGMKPLAPMPSTPSNRHKGPPPSSILPSITALERERSNSASWSSRSDSLPKPAPLYATRESQPTKRSHDDVFQATQERTVNGQRPEVSYNDPKDPKIGWYKRANFEWKQRPFAA